MLPLRPFESSTWFTSFCNEELASTAPDTCLKSAVTVEPFPFPSAFGRFVAWSGGDGGTKVISSASIGFTVTVNVGITLTESTPSLSTLPDLKESGRLTHTDWFVLCTVQGLSRNQEVCVVANGSHNRILIYLLKIRPFVCLSD